MTVIELLRLQNKLIDELIKNTKVEDFPSYEAYKHHILGAQQGIITFYVHAMIQVLDHTPVVESKKETA